MSLDDWQPKPDAPAFLGIDRSVQLWGLERPLRRRSTWRRLVSAFRTAMWGWRQGWRAWWE